MLIDSKTFEKLALGKLTVRVNADGSYSPVRFTDRQLAFYSRTQSDEIRSLASAGVSLACRTDATAISLDYGVLPGSSQDVYGFDMYEDGALTHHAGGKISENRHGAFRFELKPGIKRIRLFFPNLAITEVESLELENACFAQPEKLKRLLFLGDSITQGYTTRFPSLTLVNLLSLRLDADVLNQGVAGEVFESGMLDGDLGFTPDEISVAYGTNDWNLREKAEFEREAEAYINRMAAIWPDTRINVLSPIWRADAEMPKRPGFEFSDVASVLKVLTARQGNMRLIDGALLFPPCPELLWDGQVHPNELGYTFYAERLVKALGY